MSEEKNIIDELLEKGYSKQDIHSALHKCMLQIIQHEKKNECVGQEMLKQVQHDVVQHDVVQHDDVITPAKNHPHPVVYFTRGDRSQQTGDKSLLKKIDIRKHVIGKALSLLKSQFAKKPKNPV